MHRLLLPLLALFVTSGLAMSQIPDRSSHLELFGGYTYINPDFSLVSGNGVSGWNASVNFKAREWLGVVADFSGFYASYPTSYPATAGNDSYTFLFGPQVSMPLHRFTPFAHFLTGFVHVSPHNFGPNEAIFKSNNAFSFAAGGGVDYSITKRLGLRGQLDLLYVALTPIGGGDPGVNYIKNRSVARISTGVVLRF